MKRQAKPEVYTITGARNSLSDDVAGRTRRYLLTMGIRTVCLVGAVIAHGPLRWVLILGAVVLPYFAVVVANTARRTTPAERPDPVTPQAAPTLDAPPASEQRHPPAA